VFHKRDGLAGVVQQDREVEQLGLVQLAEDTGVAFVPFELGLPQTVQIFNGPERVFIHRETVRDLAHGKRVNPLQLRQEQSQQMEGVHRAQRVRRMQFRQNIFEKTPKNAATLKAGGQPRPRLFQLMFGGRTEFEPRAVQSEERYERKGPDRIDFPASEKISIRPGRKNPYRNILFARFSSCL